MGTLHRGLLRPLHSALTCMTQLCCYNVESQFSGSDAVF
jgi:hypothetical protein